MATLKYVGDLIIDSTGPLGAAAKINDKDFAAGPCLRMGGGGIALG